MSETALTPPKRKSTASYEAAAAELLNLMTRFEERMDLHQSEAERLKAETQAVKVRTEGVLSRLQDQFTRLSEAV